MSDFIVIGGNASENLAQLVAKRLDAKFIPTKLKIFPDGESKLTINGQLKNKKIVIVQSTHPPVDSNLIRLVCLISKAREFSSKVYVVIPYLGYTRQDKEFLKGEIISISTVASILKAVKPTKIIVMDIHSKSALSFFKMPITHTTAIPLLAKYFKKIKLRTPIVVAVDLFWTDQAKEFARLLKIDFIGINKKRDRHSGKIRIVNSNLKSVQSRDVILLDDMISTGNSMAMATTVLKQNGCRRVFGACTHALLVNDAQKKIRRAGVTKIVSANTIPGKTNIVDVSDILSKAIKSTKN